MQGQFFDGKLDVGVAPQQAMQSLAGFRNVRRRLECIASVRGIEVYDDFAHHPTAIEVTLAALRGRVTGLAWPTYVLDIPGGHGKVPIGPDYLTGDGAVRDPSGVAQAVT